MASLPPETRLLYQFGVSQGEFQKISEETSGLRRALLNVGFPSGASRRALVSAYELGMNIVIHAYDGVIKLLWKDGSLLISAHDRGPGIDDTDLAMKEGYSTAPDYVREMGYGAGMGLPNVRNLTDSFTIESEKDEGTWIECLVQPGPSDLQSPTYFHSVTLDPEKCKGCTNCIKGCPTEAIRVRSGKAFILEDRCIDCGECIRRCPNHAKSAVSDSLASLANFDHKIALVPPSFYGTFKGVTRDEVCSALLAEGLFDDVFDVSIAADLASRIMREYIESHKGKGPFISPACPAVLRLIQVEHPSLLEQVIPCEAPMEIAAWLAKTIAVKSGLRVIPSAVFISPCPAKITAARQPVGRGRSLVDAVISSAEAHAWVTEHLGTEARSGTLGLEQMRSTRFGLGWGGSGGEMEAVGVRGLAVHGISEVALVLDELETGALTGEVDFVEAQACPGGCAGGCLNPSNPFVTAMRVEQVSRSAEYTRAEQEPRIQAVEKDEPQLWFSLGLLPRPVFRLDEDPEKAEGKLRRLVAIESELPGLDCGACGAPTCRALAEDIVLGRGSAWDCTFKLRERLEDLADEVKDLATRRPPAMSLEKDNGKLKG